MIGYNRKTKKKRLMINMIIGHKSKTHICLLHDWICCCSYTVIFYNLCLGLDIMYNILYILDPGKITWIICFQEFIENSNVLVWIIQLFTSQTTFS